MASRQFRSDDVGLRTAPSQTQGPTNKSYFNSEPEYKEPPAKNTRKRTIWIITIIVIAIITLIILGIVLYFVLKKKPATTSGGTGGGSATTNPVGGACTGNNNCNTGLVCNNLVCKQPPVGSCSSSSDCMSGYVCAGGSCLGTSGATCSSNAECIGSYKCSNTTCQLITCTTESDCLNGYYCNNNVCQGPIGSTCTAPNQCVASIPYQPSTGNGGQSYCSSISYTCGGMVGDGCADDTECAYPFVCTGNVCSYKPCTDVNECPTSDIGTNANCIAGNCVIALGGLVSVPVCTQNSQCDPRDYNDGQEVICAEGNCGFLGGIDCTAYVGLGSVCGLSSSGAYPCPVPTCICDVDADCISTLPHCVNNNCQATPTPITATHMKSPPPTDIQTFTPTPNIPTFKGPKAMNMGRKEVNLNTRKKLKIKTEFDPPEYTNRRPEIRSSAIRPYFEDTPTDMLDHF